MSARRKYFAQCKGNVSPEARIDAEWQRHSIYLTLEGDKCEVGGRDVAGVGRLRIGAR